MKTDLTAIEEALAGLTDAELHALIVASNEAPKIASGLLAWIASTCDWEVNRRVGRNYDLLPPEPGVDPSEDAVGIEALRAAFSSGDMAIAALKFLDAVAELLTGGGWKPGRR